ncbi:MAG: DegT/DnrJ/EryC1/StrS family aminotransferase [Actinomycetales bacterium]|nr:DegT/DnrJ/EryC1/StrS family aminotransferase [Actinomycetales bacterium]
MSELAALGGTPIRSAPYPAWPHYDDSERDGLLRVLESRNWWSSQGVEVRAFEQEWAAFTGAPHAVAMTNGTHTLEAALLATGIGAGDEVIVPDWSFFATIGAVLAVNAVPVIVDVDPRTGTMDPALAEAAITGRTRAILVVHVCGSVADMDAITALAQRHGLRVIEDCAHAHGSTWHGVHAGLLGDAGSFSFQASKLMTAGEGGAVITRHDDVAALLASYVSCGRDPGTWYYRHFRLGENWRMTEWQGAVLRCQLARFPQQQANRAAHADLLNAELARIPGVTPQGRLPGCDSQGNYCYVVMVDPDEFGASRDHVRTALLAEGIPLTTSYPPLHALELFSDPAGLAPRIKDRSALPDYARQSFPVTERLAATSLWFTTSVLNGTDEDALDVVRAMEKVHRLRGQLAEVDAVAY